MKIDPAVDGRSVRLSSFFSILALAVISIGPSAMAAAPAVHGVSEATLGTFAPPGYEFLKHIPWSAGPNGEALRIVAFSDVVDSEDTASGWQAIPQQPVMFRLLRWRKEWSVLDTVLPHHQEPAKTGAFDWAPNYFADLDRVRVGDASLILARSVASAGGSGSLNYFDFSVVERDRLKLVKSFEHGRFERYYFAMQGDSVFDGELVCKRGERRKGSYVHTCYIQVTRYGFDGRSLVATGSERLGERRGNFALQDDYRFVSVGEALAKGEIFGAGR